MSVFDIFSKRQKQLRGEVPDVYVYDRIPQPLRVQIVHIWHDAIGSSNETGIHRHYKFIVELLCREYGFFRLSNASVPFGPRDYLSELTNFLLSEDTEKVLDAVEVSFRVIDRQVRMRASKVADDAIQELNTRFREHGIGYEYDGEVIRIDSQLLHAEVVKPTLALLRATPEYAGAQAEFLTAHQHYLDGLYKEALTECLKAMESVMKAICTKRGWPFSEGATAAALLQLLFEKSLVPLFWQQHFAALRSTLESGVPTGRNKLGAHGQGATVQKVPEHIVAYVLHLTTSAIVFLAAAESTLP